MILHKHHIIPKHAGGSDNSSNIKYVTIGEHAEEHRKLYEKYGKIEDYLAWKGLSGNIGKEEILRELSAQNGRNRKGSKQSEEARKKISKASKKMWENLELRKRASLRTTQLNLGKTLSDETKEKIGNSKRGQTHSEESRIKMSQSHTGKKKKPFNSDAKKNISEALKAKYARDKKLGIGRYSKSHTV